MRTMSIICDVIMIMIIVLMIMMTVNLFMMLADRAPTDQDIVEIIEARHEQSI